MDCHYEFLRMRFRMMNSGATLTRAVKKLLCEMDNVVDYIDDLLIHTETWEAHVKTLSELFKRLHEANFTVRPVKCLLGSRTVDFLEQVYVEGQPNVVIWGDSQEGAYNLLKVAVTSKPALQLPEVNKKFVLRTDASDRGLGAALMQENEGTLFPVAYARKKLTDRERKYSVTEREALVFVWGVKKFSFYLYGTVFTLQTDHALWLRPRNSPYGSWPRDGEIDVMESRGNKGSWNVEMVRSTVHWGTSIRDKKAAGGTKQGATWHNQFHIYKVEWTPDHIATYVDSHRIIYLEAGTSMYDKGHFSGPNIWASGSKMAPFDQEFYFIMNVAVGGISGYFPDSPRRWNKPWRNNSPNPAKDFWDGRNDWLPTWKGDQVAMIVDWIQFRFL
ncbi:Zinc finger protein [Plakobranchus ocellatus]|uniref:Zinc finger protein n=1 Tax=Plakobranchus ocellatus TaxID=259542 RepID=A0AAV4CBN4_9GAST|nr:Zinc finger protein [Plakobranchus ocellatus]